MSVDERLRRGLEANATSFDPQGEARLDVLRRRHRRRRVTVAVAMASVVVSGTGIVWLVGGGDGSGRGVDPASPTSTPPTTAPTAPATVPDSNWRRTVTRSEAQALGVGAGFLRDNFGGADRLPLVLSFVGGLYTQSGRYPGGWSVGDAGRVSYDVEGRLVLTSNSPECFGCVMTLDWSITDDGLRLGRAGDRLAPADRLMMAGSWSRQAP